jgi:hypothetical protein
LEERYSVRPTFLKIAETDEWKAALVDRLILFAIMDTGAANGNGFLSTRTVSNLREVHRALSSMGTPANADELIDALCDRATVGSFIGAMVNELTLWSGDVDARISESLTALSRQVPEHVLEKAAAYNGQCEKYDYMHFLWAYIATHGQICPRLDVDTLLDGESFMKTRILMAWVFKDHRGRLVLDTSRYDRYKPFRGAGLKTFKLEAFNVMIDELWAKLINNPDSFSSDEILHSLSDYGVSLKALGYF